MQTQHDQYVMSLAGPMLVEGEQVSGIGKLYVEPSKAVRILPLVRVALMKHYYAVTTNFRIILIKTDVDGWGKPKLYCGGIESIDYSELTAVRLDKWMQARQMDMTFLDGRTVRYEALAECKALSGHAQFYAQFPDWLAHQVQSGVFADPTKIAAARERRAAQAQQQAAAFRAQSDKVAKTAKGAAWIAMVVAGTMLLVVGCFSVVVANDNYGGPVGYEASTREAEGYRALEKLAEADLARLRDGKKPKKDCPDPDIFASHEIDTYGSRSCHHCTVYDDRDDAVDAGSYTWIERDDEHWLCPDEDGLESDIRHYDDMASMSEEQAERELEDMTMAGAVAGVSPLLGMTCLVLGIRRRKKQKAEAKA